MNVFLKKTALLAAIACAFSGAALADLSDTKTLSGTQSLNLETGATAASGGDVLWNGTSLTPQGTAKAGILPGLPFDNVSQSVLQVVLTTPGLASSSPIPSSSLAVGTIVAVMTNSSHPAKLLITAISANSITIQFTTYGATGGGGGGGGPTISRVTNNSSDIPAGFPNSAISQGALFKIVGSGLADDGDANLHDSNAPSGLPKLLNGARVTVTSGSFSVDVALYYATPTQIDGVLPSNTPTGTATITVTHNGNASSAFTIQVVAGGPGITTYNNGTAVAQDTARPNDPYGGLITFTKSAPLGAVIIIWGSGFGATVDDDVKYTGTPHETSVSYTIYVGGIQASIAYKGRSVYPGVSVFAVTIPQNAPQGCYVPIVAVTGVFVSNTATLPIHAGGGECSDPQFGITGSQLSGLTGTVKSGFLLVSQSTAPGTGVSNNAVAIFQQTSGISAPGGGGIASVGGCIVTQGTTGGSGGTTNGLSAGTITVSGPGGAQATLTGIPLLAGFYAATLPSIPANGGTYVFNSTAGSQVGAFSGVTVNFPNPLMVWTNQNAAATVARSQGLTINWTGGTPGSYVLITGSSTSGTLVGTFVCYAPQSALTFTVPTYITLSMPAGNGTTSVTNSTNLTPFAASGLDFAAAFGSLQFTVNSNYN